MYGQSNHGRRVVGDEVGAGGDGSGGGKVGDLQEVLQRQRGK